MTSLSQDLAKLPRSLVSIAFCIATSFTTSHTWADSFTLDQSPSAVLQRDVIPIGLVDIFLLPLVQFLNANGDVSPKPNAYFPEHGDPGYFDTYYGKVDPQGKRATLNGWLQENDFLEYPYLVKKAEYINAADLGFGRQMHCIGNGRSSCYVKNYLDPKGASTFAATVAMERMPNDYGTFVAYFVYDSAGNRINQIALDSQGPKSLPESCWACHGGYGHGYTFFGGNYLPFDVDKLQDWPDHPTRASQANQFRALNLIVWNDAEYLAHNSNLTDLIERWYGGIPFAGTSYTHASTPLTWVTDATGGSSQNKQVYKKHKVENFLYQKIYGEYCRLCHIAQDLDWQDAHALDFTLAAYNHLCTGDNSPTMPHAEVTYNDFFDKQQHQMPSLYPPTQTSDSNISVNNLRDLVVSNQLVGQTGQVGQAIDDLVASPKYTGYEMLCEKLPLGIPAGNKTNGASLFSSKGCASCHYIGTFQNNKVGGDIECRGAWLRQNMGSVNPAMSGITLNMQNIQDISLYLNDRPACH